LGKTLRAEKGNGNLPELKYLSNQDEETRYCADKISASVKNKETTWSDWAILYRTNAQSLGFETLFLRSKIPYRVVGSLKFYEREEIKDALALLALLVNPRDEIAFRRVVNKPTRAIGAVSVDKIVDAAICNDGNLLEAGKNIDLSAKAGKGLAEFIKVIEDGKKLLNEEPQQPQRPRAPARGGELIANEGLSILITQLVKDSGIADYHKEQDEISGNSKVGNLQELVNASSKYKQSQEGLIDFLEDIELDRSMQDTSDELTDAVTLITFHNTKGLEFKRVIMTGLEQGIFPREEKKDEELEEERRLFYVGATRAMDELYLTSCAERRMYGKTMPSQPSLFLSEIDKSNLLISRGQGTGDRGQRITPPSFNSYSFNNNKVDNDRELEEKAGYKRGDRVSHEHHGHGGVVKIKDSPDGPIVHVRFDNGKETFFNSEKLSNKFEKIDNW